ncbi:hypothetical protein VPH35_112272 [Triticum aestivum]|uniref:BAH domain-containing protein n=2 Tax=Triticum TaxID=4564 RepID=A0A9R1BDS3_TRITD|nr:uncharacterized protein LOC123138257 [Triticum aestivum]VAI60883.1 unnamed protein product [Triticum turgidum subsp. durum]
MHGRRQGCGEGCGDRRPFVRHMWPATRVEAAPPPAKGPASPPPPPRSSLPPLRTTSYPPAPTTPPAAPHKQEAADSPRPPSADSFLKDGREFRVGDCALFQAVDVPPFIGLIRWIEKKEEGFPKLRVSWLYRSADVKLNKAIPLNAAPNEIFYSFHQDETSAVSLLHPCKVAFLRKGVELPAGISSFVCRRVYDIDNKCLWWLTDKDYINERQEEVNRLLHRTRLEMHAAVQSGGRSPKRLNSPSSAQQKAGLDDGQNCILSKGKKRDRVEQGIDPATRDRDRPLKVEEGELGNLKAENMKHAFTKFIAKFTDKGGLPHAEAVEKLVQFMQVDRTERKIDLGGRVALAHIISATESPVCLGRFVQLRGLPILNEWLQETHKGKSGEGGSPKETDKRVEEFLMALLRALSRLPINLNALQSCSIGKSVNHLRSHKSAEIQKRAKCLVENWKKRVDAEMKSNEAKPLVSGQAVSWSGKGGAAEVSNGGNRRSASSEASPKNPVSRTAKPGASDAVTKSNPLTSCSSKLQHMQPANFATNSKDPPCKSAGGSELPTVKEEKSSSSSQSLNNSHSCSSDHARTFGSPWKEDARSSTAASGNASKTSGSSSRVHRRANSVRLGSGIQKEATAGRSASLDRSSFQEKSSQSGMASEKGGDTPSDNNSNGHRLIVRFPNPSRSPARSVSGGSFEDPSVTGSRSSSPVDKHEQNGRRVKMKIENSRPELASDANAESWHSNEIKGVAGSDEGDKSAFPTLESNRNTEEAVKEACASRPASSSQVNEKGICSSETKGNSFNPMNALIEIKYSEAGPPLQAGDDTAMNLLASVAGEISKSDLISPSASPRNSSANEVGCEGDSIEKLKVERDIAPSQLQGSSDVQKVILVKQEKADPCLIAKEERNQRAHLSLHDNKITTSTGLSPQNGTDCNAVESSAKTENQAEGCADKCLPVPGADSQGQDRNACSSRGPVEDGRISSPDVVGTALGGQCNSAVSNRTSELLPPEELQLSAPDKQPHALLKQTDKKPLGVVLDQLEAMDTRDGSTGSKLDLKSSVCPLVVGPTKAEVLGVNTVLKEDEKEQPSSTSADVNKLFAFPVDVPNGIKESKDSSSESSSQVKPRAIISQDFEHDASQSPKKLSDDVGAKEDLVSSGEGSSMAAQAKPNVTAKLDFDLNELGDEGNHSEPVTSPVICTSGIHVPGLSPFVSPVLSGLPAPITVAAPAKGPFVPPENLLRVKPEAGWKGSAATSAFRPAEPRKVVGTSLTAPDIVGSDAAGKRSRPAFDIDLNVADDQILEEDISQSSAQTVGSESGNSRSRDGPVRSAGIELDLNRADEVAENNQFISNSSNRVEVTLLPARSLPGGLPSTSMNGSKNFFDLNNGPSLDEASTEPAQRSLSSKGASSIPFLPQVAGLRMNGTEINNMSPWFASANPYAPVAMQSFLPARGEQPYPIETASGTQRMIVSAADSCQFGSDSGRAPVVSTPPTMVFHPPPAYQYAGFPFTPSVHLQTAGFPIGSTSYANSAPAGVSYFPTIAPSLVGSTGALPPQHVRQYAINRPEGSSSDGLDSNWKWKRPGGFDLNSGPGSIDLEGKDERILSSVRQNLMTPQQAFAEEQTRMYQLPGVGIKRKEPEGSWDPDRSSYKQLSWQ